MFYSLSTRISLYLTNFTLARRMVVAETIELFILSARIILPLN